MLGEVKGVGGLRMDEGMGVGREVQTEEEVGLYSLCSHHPLHLLCLVFWFRLM